MFRRRPRTIERPAFPDTLAGMGYKINDQHQLRGLENDGPFLFDVRSKDRPYNEAHYTAVLNFIGDFIEDSLQNDFGLVKEILPIGADPTKNPFSKVYMTPGALETTEKLLVLLPSSNIRVGQWSRRVIIDESIDKGSMIDTIKLARQAGFEHFFVFNPNENSWVNGKGTSNMVTTKSEPIPENETPERHCEYVFKTLLSKAKSNKICWIVAGWGGHCLSLLINMDGAFFEKKVNGVAMANTVHTIENIHDEGSKAWIQKHVTNWTCADTCFGTTVDDPRFGCQSFSAGVELPDNILMESLPVIMGWFTKVTEESRI